MTPVQEAESAAQDATTKGSEDVAMGTVPVTSEVVGDAKLSKSSVLMYADARAAVDKAQAMYDAARKALVSHETKKHRTA